MSSTATVSAFTTDGTLGAQSFNVVSGGAVSGSLPGNVVFSNTNGINDYNHSIQLGNLLSFLITFNPSTTSSTFGSSTFSLGLFSDEGGTSPLLGGTQIKVSLMNDGSVTATPIPTAAWLLGTGLIGLVGIRRRMTAIKP